MEMGFGKFFEAFETRFGRNASTALLGVIALAVAAVSVSLIFANIVLPLIGFFWGVPVGQGVSLVSMANLVGLIHFIELMVMVQCLLFVWLMITQLLVSSVADLLRDTLPNDWQPKWLMRHRDCG